jgi:hypothetical protein
VAKPTANHEHAALHQGIVARLDRFEREAADPGPREDRLRDDRTAEEAAELEPDERRHRKQRVPERVAAQDRPLRETLRARRAHEIRGERLVKRGADEPRENRRHAEPERDRGKQ